MYGPLWFVLLLSVRGFLSGVISKQESKIHVKVRLRSSHVLRADCLCAASGFVEGLLAGQRTANKGTGQAHSRTSSWAVFVGTRTLSRIPTHPPIYPQSCSRRKLVRTRRPTGRAITDNTSSSPPAKRARYTHSICHGNTPPSEQHPDFYSAFRSSRPPSVVCAQRSSRPTLVLSLTSTTSCPRRSN